MNTGHETNFCVEGIWDTEAGILVGGEFGG